MILNVEHFGESIYYFTSSYDELTEFMLENSLLLQFSADTSSIILVSRSRYLNDFFVLKCV